MRGTDWTRSLPACEPVGKTPAQYAAELHERSRMVLDAVKAGLGQFNWCSVVAEEKLSDGQVHRADLLVLGDPMRIGDEGDQIRPTCSHPTAQRIADFIGALLPTEKVADLAWLQSAVKLVPQTMPPDARMASTARMIENSRMVDHVIQVAGFAPGGALFGSASKYWALTNELVGKPYASANAGWHVDPSNSKMPSTRFRTPGGLHVLQPLAEAHTTSHDREADHDDYSQKVAYLVLADCIVDGLPRKLGELYQHPLLSKLVSYEGPLKILKHPAVTSAGAEPHSSDVGLGDRGELVAEWQRWLVQNGFPQIRVDGDFGPKTESATRNAQARNNIPQTGRLDAQTQVLMGSKPVELHAPSGAGPFADDIERYPDFANLVDSRRLAKFYTPVLGPRRPIDGVCIHSTESARTDNGAESVALYFADPKAPIGPNKSLVPVKASAHIVIDNNSVVQCVPIRDVAYAAPGANRNFIHIELVGHAAQTEAEWTDSYGTPQLALLGKVIAAFAKVEGFPIVEVGSIGLTQNERGVTTHVAVTNAFHESTHTDPGHHFPMGLVLELANTYLETI